MSKETKVSIPKVYKEKEYHRHGRLFFSRTYPNGNVESWEILPPRDESPFFSREAIALIKNKGAQGGRP